MFNYHPFSNCCGAQIVSGFWRSARYTDVERINNLESHLKDCAITIAILRTDQNKVYEDYLLKLGFKVSGPVRNPNTGHNLYTYLYENKPKPRTKKTTKAKSTLGKTQRKTAVCYC